jgi:hypothetical protein
MAAHLVPDEGDVVVRQKHGNPSTVYLLGTPSAPEQFILRTRDEAVSQALAFAKRQRAGMVRQGRQRVRVARHVQKRRRGTGEVIVTAKSAKRKTADALATAADRSAEVLTDATANVTEHDIARRAYDLYLARDHQHGHDLDDWLQAERELRDSRRSTGV